MKTCWKVTYWKYENTSRSDSLVHDVISTWNADLAVDSQDKRISWLLQASSKTPWPSNLIPFTEETLWLEKWMQDGLAELTLFKVYNLIVRSPPGICIRNIGLRKKWFTGVNIHLKLIPFSVHMISWFYQINHMISWFPKHPWISPEFGNYLFTHPISSNQALSKSYFREQVFVFKRSLSLPERFYYIAQ